MFWPEFATSSVAAASLRCHNSCLRATRILNSPLDHPHSRLSLGELWHCVILGLKDANQKLPQQTATVSALTAKRSRTCRRCTWRAKASSAKKCCSSPSAKKSNRNLCAAKSPPGGPPFPPTFITEILRE